MTKKEKIASLATFMKKSVRDDMTDYYHFTDSAPETLKDIYLEHYEVRDIDYETFSVALDMLVAIYDNVPLDNQNAEYVEDSIYEAASDCASVYTADRLAYLDALNQEEISEIVHSISSYDIATACAIWYCKQVEEAAFIIKAWIDEK